LLWSNGPYQTAHPAFRILGEHLIG